MDLSIQIFNKSQFVHHWLDSSALKVNKVNRWKLHAGLNELNQNSTYNIGISHNINWTQ